MSPLPSEALLTFPGVSPDSRGAAHLIRVREDVVAVGELEDNPGESTVDTLEVIDAGLVAYGIVPPQYTLLHYLPRDHVNHGDPAVWLIVWHGRDGSGDPVHRKPTWDPVPPEMEVIKAEVLAVVEQLQAYDLHDVSARTTEEVELYTEDDVRDVLETALNSSTHDQLWSEIAELGFGPDASYTENTGHIESVRRIRLRSADLWEIDVEVAFEATQANDVGVFEATGYRVSITADAPSFPTGVSDIWIAY